MIHELKTWSPYYRRIVSGEKTFEVRKNDRDYQVGDSLRLKEYDPIADSYSGCCTIFKVGYVLHGGSFGIEKDTVVMSLVDADQC